MLHLEYVRLVSKIKILIIVQSDLEYIVISRPKFNQKIEDLDTEIALMKKKIRWDDILSRNNATKNNYLDRVFQLELVKTQIILTIKDCKIK